MARWTQNGKSERHVIRSGTRGQRLGVGCGPANFEDSPAFDIALGGPLSVSSDLAAACCGRRR